jgi:hypothetical protein
MVNSVPEKQHPPGTPALSVVEKKPTSWSSLK